MQTSSHSTHSDDSLLLGASMSGCAVPEQRGTLSPVGSSWTAVELLSDERDPSLGFGHVIQHHVGPSQCLLSAATGGRSASSKEQY